MMVCQCEYSGNMNIKRAFNNTIRFGLTVCATLILGACGSDVSQNVTKEKEQVRVLEWGELMPEDYDPSKVVPDLDISDLSDDDPRLVRYSKMLREAWNNAPVVSQLNGQNVKVPGFMVPVEYDEKNISQFLLVPYFGACIHSPPPPSNQIINVKSAEQSIRPDSIWEPVWVTGILKTEYFSNELGDASYAIEAANIEPYVEESVDSQ